MILATEYITKFHNVLTDLSLSCQDGRSIGCKLVRSKEVVPVKLGKYFIAIFSCFVCACYGVVGVGCCRPTRTVILNLENGNCRRRLLLYDLLRRPAKIQLKVYMRAKYNFAANLLGISFRSFIGTQMSCQTPKKSVYILVRNQMFFTCV
jgi:hypothetical protein